MKQFFYQLANSLNRASRGLDEPAEKDDKMKSLMEMISDYDYPIEKHYYTTKDDYINCVSESPATEAKPCRSAEKSENLAARSL